MTGKRWLAAAGLATLLAQAGCVTCCHTAAKTAYEVGPDCDIPLCDRQRVYAVLLGGLTGGMDTLRDGLAARGFTKVYVAPPGPVGWLEREMVRVCAEEPGARFVVVGSGLGCIGAKDLAAAGLAAGVPVDAVVYLDPAGVDAAAEAPTVVVQPGSVGETLPGARAVFVPSSAGGDLPAHPRSLDAVHRRMAESAGRVVHPPVVLGPEPDYPYAPPVRFLPADLGDPEAGPLSPLDPPARVGPYGVSWPNQRLGRPLPMPRKADPGP